MTLPTILSSEILAEGAEYLLDVTADLPWFRGHFPGHPVLPGLVQVEWARRLSERDLMPDAGFQGLRAVKFQRVVKPGSKLCLRLSRGASRVDWLFSLDDAEGIVCSSGQILFGEAS